MVAWIVKNILMIPPVADSLALALESIPYQVFYTLAGAIQTQMIISMETDLV